MKMNDFQGPLFALWLTHALVPRLPWAGWSSVLISATGSPHLSSLKTSTEFAMNVSPLVVPQLMSMLSCVKLQGVRSLLPLSLGRAPSGSPVQSLSAKAAIEPMPRLSSAHSSRMDVEVWLIGLLSTVGSVGAPALRVRRKSMMVGKCILFCPLLTDSGCLIW